MAIAGQVHAWVHSQAVEHIAFAVVALASLARLQFPLVLRLKNATRQMVQHQCRCTLPATD